MKIRFHWRLYSLTLLPLAFVIAGYINAGGAPQAKSSDPRLSGPRDMNYDHLIVAGSRIGPVHLGGSVTEAVKHLGNPSKVLRGTHRGYTDEITYVYTEECINFTWMDSGIDPTVENGLRGINVWCDKWSTPDGLHVGSSMQEVSAHIGTYCPINRNKEILIETKQGIWYFANNRNSPISRIAVVPIDDSWPCKD